MQNNILFDNIYIGHSVEDAEKFAEETFKEKIAFEKLAELADKPKADKEKPKSPSDLVFLDDPVFYIKEKLSLFFAIAQQDPIQAIKFVPEAAGGLVAVFVTVVALLVSLVGFGSSAAPTVKKAGKDAKASAADAKDAVADAATSAVDQAKEGVSKRTTRSSS